MKWSDIEWDPEAPYAPTELEAGWQTRCTRCRHIAGSHQFMKPHPCVSNDSPCNCMGFTTHVFYTEEQQAQALDDLEEIRRTTAT